MFSNRPPSSRTKSKTTHSQWQHIPFHCSPFVCCIPYSHSTHGYLCCSVECIFVLLSVFETEIALYIHVSVGRYI